MNLELAAHRDAFAGVVRRDAILFFSYRFRFATQLFQAVFSAALFYYISRLVRSSAFDSPDDYFLFVVVGILALQLLTATVGVVPMNLRQELVTGTFEREVASPFGASATVLSMVVWPFLSTVTIGLVTLALCSLIFDLSLDWATAPLSIPLLLLIALALAPFSVFMSAAVLSLKQAGAGVGLVVTSIAFTSGFFFPVDLLPAAVRWASDVQPFTPALDLLRHVLIGSPVRGSVGAELAKLVLFAGLLLPCSVAALEAAIRRGRRRGTLTEY